MKSRSLSRITALLCSLTVLAGAAAPALTATLSVQARLADHKPFAGAVITLKPLSAHAAVPPVKAIVDQINLAFVPDMIAVPVGSTVEFPNSDSVSHQIYSFSTAKRFQLPLYHGKPYPPVQFDQAGVVTLGCNIHDKMVGYIYVTDAAYFGRTDASGVWTAANVPRGSYHLSLWHPLLRDSTASLERDVSVGADESSKIDLQLTQPLRAARLQSARTRSEY